MRSRLAAALAAALLCLALPASAQEVEAEVALRLQDPRIQESSGMASAAATLGALDPQRQRPPRRAVRRRPGGTDAGHPDPGRGGGADWEMAAGRDDRGRPALFVGDIGDNNGVWPEVAVYRVTEPARLRDATVPAVRYRLRYADGPHDAEALLVDPRGNRLYVATKGLTGGGLYRPPGRPATGSTCSSG